MNTSANRTYTNKAKNTLVSGYKNTANAVGSTYNKFRGLSTVVQVLIGLVVVVIVILLILWIYNLIREAQYRSKQSPFLITTPINAFNKNNKPVRTKNVPNPVDGLSFTYSFWMYVANWTYRFGQWKNVLVKGNPNTSAPNISLNPKTNSLTFEMNTYSNNNSIQRFEIRNVPLQKWVHVVYVLNNRNIDVYIDGKLERSVVLRAVPKLNNNDVKIADQGGFWGQLAKMQYFTRALLPSEVADIYSEGPYTSRKFTLFDGNDDSGNNNCSNNGGDDDTDDNDNSWTQDLRASWNRNGGNKDVQNNTGNLSTQLSGGLSSLGNKWKQDTGNLSTQLSANSSSLENKWKQDTGNLGTQLSGGLSSLENRF